MVTAVMVPAGEVRDAEGLWWEQDRCTDLWDSPDCGLFGMPTEWLVEHRLVTE